MIRLQSIAPVLRHGAYLTGTGWIEALLGVLYIIVITNFLGVESYSVWAYVIAAYSFAISLVGFGVEALSSIWLGSRREDAERFIGASLFLRVIFLSVASLGLLTYTLIVSPPASIVGALLLVAPALVGRGVAYWARFIFMGLEQIPIYARLTAIMRCAEVLIGSAMLWAGLNLTAILLLHSLVWLAEAGISLRIIHRRLARIRIRAERTITVELLSQGAVLGMANALMSWLMLAPLLLAPYFALGLSETGQLALAMQFTALAVMTTQTFFATALPSLSRAVAQADPRVARYASRAGIAAGSVCLTAAALGVVFGERLVTLVFGPDFAAAGNLLGPSLLVAAAVTIPTGYGQLLVVSGRRWPGVIAAAIGGTLLCAVYGPAVQHSGPLGAVLASFLGWGVRGIILFTWQNRLAMAASK